ncbi:Uncharacterized protein OBRU01_22067, partial [Operophtera brumata]
MLQWTSPHTEPFVFMNSGVETFVKRKCPVMNCYVTSNRNLLGDVTNFDVLLFHGKEVVENKPRYLPKRRTHSQKYVFSSMESSGNYPVPKIQYNNYFNMTWTYKLDSDIYFGYIVIKNRNGDIIGPHMVMHWMNNEEMLPINDTIKTKIANKSVAAAWFVSNCRSSNKRNEVFNSIKQEMIKYGMIVHVYGDCGDMSCPRSSMNDCLKLIETNYYFYFAFENSIAEDYVTEKLLHALKHYAIPVLDPTELARQMFEIINEPDRYNDFFKWHNHYSYHDLEESSDTDPYCKLCDYVNRVEFVVESKVISDLEYWWNPHVDPLKYILIWTWPNHDPLMYLGKGQETFVKKNCKVKNCFITTNKSYFKDITEFDVILFNGPEVVDKRSPKLPLKRSPDQNYVFASIESSDYYPICDNKFDGYFNVSWTYKLNSDIFYGYIIIRNKDGDVIGPKKEMHWMSIDEMQPINDTIKEKLSSKKKLAAWLVSNCNAPSGRDGFVKRVQNKLKKMGNGMTVDVYGDCGTTPCRRADMPKCLEMIEKQYYFYFSFENSFTEDYVTEKVLHPLQHYAVPVVFGTANYTRWMNHYTFHYVEEAPETDFHCKFCEAMNNNSLMKNTTVIQNFKEDLVENLECYLEDLVDSFENFVKKSLILISVGVGSMLVEHDSVQFFSMLNYMVTMLSQLLLYCWTGHELTIR